MPITTKDLESRAAEASKFFHRFDWVKVLVGFVAGQAVFWFFGI